MDPLVATDFAQTIKDALTSSGLDAAEIGTVAAAGIGLGIVTYGFRRMWSFFKGIAK